MTIVLQIACVILTALAMCPALAHALEAPGKHRLDEQTYRAVQGIYYPGFTLTGFVEPTAALAALALLSVTPPGSISFWLALGAAVALIGMHAVYWLVTHPVNRAWMKDQELGRGGVRFFGSGDGDAEAFSWTELRDRWERSHMLRAGLAAAAFVALVLVLSPVG
jgi:hypothetical protein